MQILKEVEMFVLGAVGSAILAFAAKWISKMFFSKTDKKKCPKCGNTDVKYLGVARIKAVRRKESSHVLHYAFECNKCKHHFDYYGEMGTGQ